MTPCFLYGKVSKVIDVEEKLQQAYLYDFYGELLNEHQRRIYEDFVFNDLSLGEIAGEEGITRQGVEVFSMGNKNKPADIAKAAVEHAKKEDCNVLIIDTAGRLHVDEEMMDELVEIKEAVDVFQTILVVDAMTGQDAVNVASTFNDKIGIDGVVLTKLDGDTRGGAALSIRAVTGKPILYAGMGEKLSDLEQFYPDRMASRILGMGDVHRRISTRKKPKNLSRRCARMNLTLKCI